MSAAPPERLHLIVNPHGGGGRARDVAREALDRLGVAGIETLVHETSAAGDARRLAGTLPLAPADALCAVGGDGTLHEIVDGMLARGDGHRCPLAVLPAGSGNALMRDLDALDPEVALARLLAGNRRRLDVARLTVPTGTLHAFHVIGWGLPARVAERSERLRWLGLRRYTLASLVTIFCGPFHEARVTADGEPLPGTWQLVFAGNTRHVGDGMCLTPDARIDSGVLDLLLMRPAGRLATLQLMGGLRTGGHLGSPLVELRKVRRFTIETDDDRPLNVDGEIAGGTPLAVELLPGAVELLA